MKKMLLIGIGIVLIVSLAMIGIVSADGQCVEQAWQCNGPSGKTTYTACGVDICTACPPGSLAYQTECAKRTSKYNYSASFSLDLLPLIKNSVRTALGQPVISGGQTSIPSTTDRLRALILLLEILMILIALLAILRLILNFLLKMISRARNKNLSAARPSYLQPTKKSGNESEVQICKVPHKKRRVQ